MENQYPIIGKWYKVIDGPYTGFVGECVSFTPDNELPVILEDMEFNGRAVKTNEIEENLKQATKKEVSRNQNN